LSFLNNTRRNIGIYILRKHSGKILRRKGTMDYSKVGSFALLYEADNSGIPADVEYCSRTLINENKIVYHIAYYPGDNKNIDIQSSDNRIVFANKDLNFFFQPKKNIIRQFDAFNPDYIVDLNFKDSFPLICLAGLSSAKLKICRQSELRAPYFDLMINDHTQNRQDFFNHLLHYIKILNPGNHE
jgi:hypothetical protein